MSIYKTEDIKGQQYEKAKSEIIALINGLPYGMVLDLFRSIKDMLMQNSIVKIEDNKSTI